MTDKYQEFSALLFDRPAPHVLRVTINNPQKRNALTVAAHSQLERVWAVIDADPEIRVSIITGAGSAFCAGGSFDEMPSAEAKGDASTPIVEGYANALGLTSAIINSKKPIISAINGTAVGAGLAIALLADVPIAANEAKLFDGHLRIGVVPGDHGALIWPLLCGIAKAKYHLMTNRPITGEQAERMNLVALAVDGDLLQETALEVAISLANTAPTALGMTKYVMNHWLRQAQPIFDLSAALEMINFLSDESKEAITAMSERRPPQFS